jgi:hypothetical protein
MLPIFVGRKSSEGLRKAAGGRARTALALLQQQCRYVSSLKIPVELEG